MVYAAFARLHRKRFGTTAGLKRHRLDPKRVIRVLAAVVQSGSDRIPGDVRRHCTALAAKRASHAAGIGPGDVSVAEVHDATAMGENIQVENLGFCGYGEGGELAERRRDPYRWPPSRQSLGRTGIKRSSDRRHRLGQIHELVTQLRGEAGPRQVRGQGSQLPRTGAACRASRKQSPVVPLADWTK